MGKNTRGAFVPYAKSQNFMITQVISDWSIARFHKQAERKAFFARTSDIPCQCASCGREFLRDEQISRVDLMGRGDSVSRRIHYCNGCFSRELALELLHDAEFSLAERNKQEKESAEAKANQEALENVFTKENLLRKIEKVKNSYLHLDSTEAYEAVLALAEVEAIVEKMS